MSNRVGICLTKFHSCDCNGNEQDTAWGHRLWDDFDSLYSDSYESLEAAVDALSAKNVLRTIVGHDHPYFLDDIKRHGGLLLDGSWVYIEDLGVEPDRDER